MLHAQPGPGQDHDVLVDGGFLILLAAGVRYPLKKDEDNKKKKEAMM